jgi:Ca2+-binding EF-hand superfamily protein
MNQPKIDVFDYDQEIASLPEPWMKDMCVVFREFDEDEDGKVPVEVGRHIMTLFRLPTKNAFKELTIVTMQEFLDDCSIIRDAIFLVPVKRDIYYFQMIAGLGRNKIDAVDIQRFMAISGDNIALKFCDDFIDEFDRVHLSKSSLSMEEFCTFVSTKKVPV